MLDITSFLSPAWLDDPGLLEFKFSHSSPGSPYIVAENTQVFRQDIFHDFGGVDYGFRLHVELETDTDADGDGVPDDSDNCPDDVNAGQENSDGDGEGDVCDTDDDNDGVADLDDNCPTDANPLQEDFDLDGLGNVCDVNFGGDEIVQEIEALVLEMRTIIMTVNPPGGNGLIAKLTGKGGVLAKVGNAVTAFGLDFIDIGTYLAELDDALDSLSAFDNQLTAKIGNGQIPIAEGSDLIALSAEVRAIIEALVSAVGG
jgi:hypothetical protein